MIANKKNWIESVVLNALLKGTRLQGMSYYQMLTSGDFYWRTLIPCGKLIVIPTRITFIEWLVMIQAAKLMCENHYDIIDDTFSKVEEVSNGIRFAPSQVERNCMGNRSNRAYFYYIEDIGRYGVITENK